MYLLMLVYFVSNDVLILNIQLYFSRQPDVKRNCHSAQDAYVITVN
jgi:hypothetical protein